MKRIAKLLRIISVLVVFSAIVFGFTKCNLFFVDSTIHPEKPPLFQVGDTLIFKSSANVDSFFVKTSKLYKINEKDDGLGDLDKERYFSELIQIDCYDSCYKFKSLIMPGEYYVGNSRLGYNSDTSLLHMDYGYSGNMPLGSVNNRLIIGKYEMKGFLEYATTFDSLCTKGINTFLYSKKYGLVQYTLYSNEVFLITEETLEMLMERD